MRREILVVAEDHDDARPRGGRGRRGIRQRVGRQAERHGDEKCQRCSSTRNKHHVASFSRRPLVGRRSPESWVPTGKMFSYNLEKLPRA
jgi:hypothetical protein